MSSLLSNTEVLNVIISCLISQSQSSVACVAHFLRAAAKKKKSKVRQTGRDHLQRKLTQIYSVLN